MTDGRFGAAPAVKVGSDALRSAAGCLPSVRPCCVVPVVPPPPPVAPPPPLPPPALPPPVLLPPLPGLPDGAGEGGAGKLTVVVEADDSTSPPAALRRRATIANCCCVPLTSGPNCMLTEHPELSQTDDGSRPPRVTSEPPERMS